MLADTREHTRKGVLDNLASLIELQVLICSFGDTVQM